MQEETKNFTEVAVYTRYGSANSHYYHCESTNQAVICVGDTINGIDSPANIYPHLCSAFQSKSLAALHLNYRDPSNTESCILDVLGGINYLRRRGIGNVALIGYGSGGSIVIQAGSRSSSTKTVITLATQCEGIEPITRLPPYCSILLLHGSDDEIYSSSNSAIAYNLAHELKKMVIYEGSDHVFTNVQDQVYKHILTWINREMNQT